VLPDDRSLLIRRADFWRCPRTTVVSPFRRRGHCPGDQTSSVPFVVEKRDSGRPWSPLAAKKISAPARSKAVASCPDLSELAAGFQLFGLPWDARCLRIYHLRNSRSIQDAKF
jgi:hypothetical protein